VRPTDHVQYLWLALWMHASMRVPVCACVCACVCRFVAAWVYVAVSSMSARPWPMLLCMYA
jgi:hypothetical protein